MPKYRFKCRSCGKEEQFSISFRQKTVSCVICASTMDRQLPTVKPVQVEETVDKLTNTSWKQNQKEIIDERKQDYYWTHLVPKLVEEASIETILENQWGYYDEKGTLRIYDRPPGKR